MWFTIVLLSSHFVLPGLSLDISVLQFDLNPCSSSNTTRLPCIQSNNCSDRTKSEICSLSVLLPAEEDIEPLNPSKGSDSKFEIWAYGCLSVGIISLSGITGAVLWPIINSPLYGYVMTALIGLAVGCLTSTALYQLIPEAFHLSTTDTSQGYLKTALFGWLSIWILFLFEGLAKIAFRQVKTKEKEMAIKQINGDEMLKLKEEDDHDHQFAPKGKVSAVALMIIFGDGLHNFVDGMTIGAGYTQSIATGLGLSIAVACEEFPHELGDFAILLQSGLSLKKAMCYNFMSACTAFIGLGFGIVLGQLEDAHFIFAFAGGLFLYVSLTHLIPELKATLKIRLQTSRSSALVFFILQNGGMLLGTTIIYFITKYNETLSNLL